MKQIELTQGKFTLIDDADFERVAEFKWYAHESMKGTFYGRRDLHLGVKNGKDIRKRIYLHRFIMNVGDQKIQVDHKNGNTLDNTRDNLRLCDNKKNSTNKLKLRSDNTSGFRGIFYQEGLRDNPWYAFIRDGNNKRIVLGRFPSAEAAAKAFDEAAKEMYGEFCGKLNFQ